MAVTLDMLHDCRARFVTIAMTTDSIGDEPQPFSLVYEQSVLVNSSGVAYVSAVAGIGCVGAGHFPA